MTGPKKNDPEKNLPLKASDPALENGVPKGARGEVLLARAELPKLPKVEKFSELNLPKVAEREKTSSQIASISSEQARIKELLKDSQLTESEQTRLQAIYSGKTRVIVAELGTLRSVVETLKKIEGSNWLALEKQISAVEKKFISVLKGVDQKNLLTVASDISLKQDLVFNQLIAIKKEREQAVRKQELQDKTLESLDPQKIIRELGVDKLVEGIKQLSPDEQRTRLLIERQRIQERVEELSKRMQQAKDNIERVRHQANKDAATQTYELKDTFYAFNAKITALEQLSKSDSVAIAIQEQNILKLSKELGVHLDIQTKFDTTIRVFAAKEAFTQGRVTEGARLLLGLKQGQLKILTEDPKNKELTQAVKDSYEFLEKNQLLSAAEKILYAKKGNTHQEMALTAALEQKQNKQKQALDQNEQVYGSQAVNIRFQEETLREYFKKSAGRYNWATGWDLVSSDGKQKRERKDLLDFQLAQINVVGENSEISVLIERRARKAIETKLPEGARLVILKPLKPFEFVSKAVGDNRRGRIEYSLNSPASDVTLKENNLAYYKNGRLYQFGGTEIDVSKEEHRDFILKQLQTARSFSVSPYNPYVELRRAGQEYQEQLWTIRTQSGEVVPGVRIKPEVQELLSKRLEDGETVALDRIPRSIELSVERERLLDRKAGGFVTTNGKYREVLIAPDIIDLQDVSLVKIEGRNLVTKDQRQNTEELLARSAENSHDILTILRENDDVKYFHQASEGIYQSFSNLQEALQAKNEGSARVEFIERVRKEAKPVHDFITSRETQERAERLKGLISELRIKLDKGVALSDSEKEIVKNIEALENFIKVIESPRTRHITETILDKSKFNADTWTNFAANDLPIILGSIAVAVFAAITIKLTLGAATPLWVVFFASTAAGAAGGIIGGEGAKELLYAQRNNFDSDVTSGAARYRNRSQAGQWWTEEDIYDEKTNSYKKLSGEEVIANYSQQFAINFALQAGAIFGSQYLGAQASKFLQQPGILEKLSKTTTGRAFIRKIAEANTRALTEGERLSIREAFKKTFKEFADEFKDELKDEFWEDVAGKSTNALIAGLSGADPENNTFVDHIGTLLVGTLKSTKVGRNTFVYNGGASGTTAASNLNNVLSQASAQGYIVFSQSYGCYSLRSAQTGEVIQIRPATAQELQTESNVVISTVQLAQGLGVGTREMLEQLARDGGGGGEEEEDVATTLSEKQLLENALLVYQYVIRNGDNQQAATEAVILFLRNNDYQIAYNNLFGAALEKISRTQEVSAAKPPIIEEAKTVGVEAGKEEELAMSNESFKEVRAFQAEYFVVPADKSIHLKAPDIGGCSVVGVCLKDTDGNQHVLMTHFPLEANARNLKELSGLLANSGIPLSDIIEVSFGICIYGKQENGRLIPGSPTFASDVQKILSSHVPNAKMKGDTTVYDRYKPKEQSEGDWSSSGKKPRNRHAIGEFTFSVKNGVTHASYKLGKFVSSPSSAESPAEQAANEVKFTQTEAAEIFLELVKTGTIEIAENFARQHQMEFTATIIDQTCLALFNNSNLVTVEAFLRRNNLKHNSLIVAAKAYTQFIREGRYDRADQFLAENNLVLSDKIKENILNRILSEHIEESLSNPQRLFAAYQLAERFPKDLSFDIVLQLLEVMVDISSEREKQLSLGMPIDPDKSAFSSMERALAEFEKICKKENVDLASNEKYQKFKERLALEKVKMATVASNDSAEGTTYLVNTNLRPRTEIEDDNSREVVAETKLSANVFDMIAELKKNGQEESDILALLEMNIMNSPEQVAKQIAERGWDNLQLSEEGKWKLLELFFSDDKVNLSAGTDTALLENDGGKLLSPREQLKRLRPYLKGLPVMKVLLPENGAHIQMSLRAEVFPGETFTLVISPSESTKKDTSILGVSFPEFRMVFLPLFPMSEREFKESVYEEALHITYGKNEFYVKLFREANLFPGEQQRPTAESVLEESLSYYFQPNSVAQSVETAVALVQDLDLDRTIEKVLQDLRERNPKDFKEEDYLAQISSGISKGNQRREAQGWEKIESRFLVKNPVAEQAPSIN